MMEHYKPLPVDGEPVNISIMDLNNTMLRSGDPDLDEDYFNGVFKQCSGVVLLFDITSRKSFDLITQNGYLRTIRKRRQFTEDGENSMPYPAGHQRLGCILVGNKVDRKEKREVSRDLAEWWAESQNMKYIELDTSKQWLINDAMAELVRSTRRAQKLEQEELAGEMERRVKGAGAAEPSASNKQSKTPVGFQDISTKLSF
jgi:GTPase SAR1 family protein